METPTRSPRRPLPPTPRRITLVVSCEPDREACLRALLHVLRSGEQQERPVLNAAGEESSR